MKQRNRAAIINDSVVVAEFSSTYPFINNHLINQGDFVPSRNGDTREVIDFKTTITNPYRRCVGNNKRDMNIFFLMAEALWIWAGRKDVEFLNLFNSRMKDYSDDGVSFHAPYGFRLRNLGLSSFSVPRAEENNHHSDSSENKGIDQIKEALQLLSEDTESRRAVMQIWDSNLDLNKKTKDLPCNDLVMLKIRDGKLRTTISNRSNDLHWGLPTNIFQFSFVSEIMSQILGIELGTQTHNSHSLHFYVDNNIAWDMNDEMTISDSQFSDIYDSFKELKMDFQFTDNSYSVRLGDVDFWINQIIGKVLEGTFDSNFYAGLKRFDVYLSKVYFLLMTYLQYQKSADKSDSNKVFYINEIVRFTDGIQYDFEALAVNFFTSKLKDRSLDKFQFNF